MDITIWNGLDGKSHLIKINGVITRYNGALSNSEAIERENSLKSLKEYKARK